MAVDDVWKLSIKGAGGGELMQCSHYFRQLDNPPGSDWQHLFDQWSVVPGAAWTDAHTDGYHLSEVEVQPVVSSGVYLRDAAQTFLLDADGDRDRFGFPDEAPWLCQVVTVRSARAGRRFRGRFFVSNLTEGDVTSQTVLASPDGASGKLDDYVDALANLFVGETAVSSYWRMCVFSRRQAAVTLAGQEVTGVVDDYAPDVTTMVRRTSLYSQKSRRTRPS